MPTLLDAFEKLQKANISFIRSLCLSTRRKQLGSRWDDFHEILYLNIFSKLWREMPFSLKSDKKNGYLNYDLCTVYLAQSSYNEKCSDKSCRENQNTYFMSNSVFLKIVPFMRKCVKTWLSQTGSQMAM